jgi:glycerophosphoryl diester phosphodiesterase
VWTVNHEKDLRRMLELNVDGIFTDDPQKARNLMAG